MRLKIFVDFWNFQLSWNTLVGKDSDGAPIRIPWKNLFARVICDAVSKSYGEKMVYSGTHVYASVDPAGDTGLKRFLNAMDSFPGFVVDVRERRARTRAIRCKACNTDLTQCPSCGERLTRTVEKGVDTALTTAMIQMAHDGVYEMAVLGSADADLCAAMKFIQERLGKQVYNLWFPGLGVQLRNACWNHLVVSNLLGDLGAPPAKDDSE